MNPNQLLQEAKTKLDAAAVHFKQEIGKIRTGRAHPGMLDAVAVEVYGQQMPLKAVGSITAPEAQLLQITPFDPNNLQAISEAIREDQSLGLNPADDGRVVRIQIPPLTEETRQQMVRILHQKTEDYAIAARNVRHEAIQKAETAEKSKQIGRDELERLKKQIDELLAKEKTAVDELTKAKEHEILTI
ncbi:MAG TPA: ribosome recycling factor [Candidatus Saccharimonadales bacterium]|nr:ribosome recycling factor [Candidatus Saccharimonadales bacterium]